MLYTTPGIFQLVRQFLFGCAVTFGGCVRLYPLISRRLKLGNHGVENLYSVNILSLYCVVNSP
jgi:hypothetical protein